MLVPHLFFLTEHNLHFTKPSMAHIWKNHPHSENTLPLKSKVFVLVNMTHPLHVSSVISVCLCHCSHMCSWPPASFLCLTMKCSDTVGCWDCSKPLSAFCCLAHRCTNGRNCKFLVNCNKFNAHLLCKPQRRLRQNYLYFSEETECSHKCHREYTLNGNEITVICLVSWKFHGTLRGVAGGEFDHF